MREITIDALQRARLALCACNNCTATDRPDLVSIPAELSWKIDNGPEIDLIDEALVALDATHDSDPECTSRNSAPSKERS
jgi:hypothetical protein